MSPEEMSHFAQLLTDLTIAAARATSVEQLTAIRVEMVDAHEQLFAMLAHDAAGGIAPVLLEDLNARLSRDDWSVRA